MTPHYHYCAQRSRADLLIPSYAGMSMSLGNTTVHCTHGVRSTSNGGGR